MAGKTFDFREQLALGEAAEADFVQLYQGGTLQKAQTRLYDFDLTDKTGEELRLELKTDTYDMARTENFFWERWSDYDKKKPGSVWQSLDKADILCYFFAKNKIYFEFTDLPCLAAVIEHWIEIHKPSMIFVQNKGYRAAGYRMPRRLLEAICREVRCV